MSDANPSPPLPAPKTQPRRAHAAEDPRRRRSAKSAARALPKPPSAPSRRRPPSARARSISISAARRTCCASWCCAWAGACAATSRLAIADAPNRLEAERRGLRAFLEFVRANPDLYRVVAESQFVDPEVFRRYYQEFAASYRAGLLAAEARGEIRKGDAEVRAWALMGISDMVGRRFALWDGKTPPEAGRRRGVRADRGRPGATLGFRVDPTFARWPVPLVTLPPANRPHAPHRHGGTTMAASTEPKACTEAASLDYDAIVIGAGISGHVPALPPARARPCSVRVFEAGTGVGGTWYWNRYPGARFDSESYSYSYSFSPGAAARNGTGRSISRRSRRRCAISTTSPTSSTCAATSSSAAA